MPEESNPSLVYRGRFAPSPSGPLHAGSLMAAVASFLDARTHAGEWLVRIEDIDPPRTVAGAATAILATLERLGLHWDGDVLYQSTRYPAYAAALSRLQERGELYACRCSRAELAESSGSYPGTCRDLALPHVDGLALRCRCGQGDTQFTDLLQGIQHFSLQEYSGDFIVRRKDDLYAYQLAVVVDDAWQGITHVTRGIDLLDSTPRQLRLQQLLRLPSPVYAHIPVLVNAAGAKLSKQNLAPPADTEEPVQVLFRTLHYLLQSPDPALLDSDVDTLLTWAIAHWQPERLAGRQQIPESSAFPAPGV